MRVPRSKPSFATSPCALVGEREGVGWGQAGRVEGPSGSQASPRSPSPTCSGVGTSGCDGGRLETLGRSLPCTLGIGVFVPSSQAEVGGVWALRC